MTVDISSTPTDNPNNSVVVVVFTFPMAHSSQVFLPSAMCVSDGEWLAEEAGEYGEGRVHGTRGPALRLYWNRQQ